MSGRMFSTAPQIEMTQTRRKTSRTRWWCSRCKPDRTSHKWRNQHLGEKKCLLSFDELSFSSFSLHPVWCKIFYSFLPFISGHTDFQTPVTPELNHCPIASSRKNKGTPFRNNIRKYGIRNDAVKKEINIKINLSFHFILRSCQFKIDYTTHTLFIYLFIYLFC